jgi:hypothetical protein
MVAGLITFLVLSVGVFIVLYFLSKDKMKAAFVFAYIACFFIGVVIGIGRFESDKVGAKKTPPTNTDFQTKLINAYKEKYGIDEDITSYDKFIKAYNK